MLKRLASETAIYGGTTILARLINYALVPLHTGVFATDSYGIVSEFYAYAAALNVVYTYGMETAYFRFSTKDKGREKPYYEQVVTSLLISSAFFSGLLIALSAPLAQHLGYPDGQKYITWFALLLAIDAVVAIPFAQLRIQHKAKKFAAVKITNILLNFGFNVFFLVICPDVVAGEYLAFLAPFVQSFYNPELGLGYAFFSNLLANSLLLPLLWRSFWGMRFRWDWPLLKPMLLYGSPIIFSGLAFSINEVSDRVLLKYWLPEGFYGTLSNLDAVGIYSACYKLSIFITLAVQAYRYAAEPFFFKEATGKNPTGSFAAAMHYFIIVLCSMALGVSANLHWLARIFITDEAYLQGLGTVPFLLMANVFLGIYYNLAVWFKVTDRTYFGAFISSGGALVTLAANFFLIPVLGYYGSATATLLCYASMSASCFVLGKKYYPVPYKLLPALGYLLGTGLLAFSLVFWWDAFTLPAIALKNVVWLALVALVVWWERKPLLQLLQEKRP